MNVAAGTVALKVPQMSVTLDAVASKKNKPEPTPEERAAEELVRRAREQGLSLTGRTGC